MPPHDDTQTDVVLPENSFSIRLMTETDLPQVYAIENSTWEDESWPMEQYFQALTDPLSTCWILEDTNDKTSILGYVFQYLHNDVSHITNLCINPARRSQGLGGRLLRHAINHAQSFGATRLILEVNITNLHAYNLYVKHGFTIIEYLEEYYSTSDDAYRMNLFLR